MVRAAQRAAAVGLLDAAASFRLRGGGFLFQAGKFLEADAVLSPVADNPGPAPVRAKAGMLRCLARGRAIALGLKGSSTALYASALEQQVRQFPSDPSTEEARWLLGRLALVSRDRDRALTLWSGMAPGSARWLDSRLAVAALDREELEREQISPDRQRLDEMLARRPIRGRKHHQGAIRVR